MYRVYGVNWMGMEEKDIDEVDYKIFDNMEEANAYKEYLYEDILDDDELVYIYDEDKKELREFY